MMAKLSDRILGERVSGYVTKPNLLDNSNFQIHQRGLSNASGSGGTFFDRYVTRGIGSTGGATALSLLRSSAAAIASPRYLAVAATGHTSFWYLRQNFRVSQITEGSDYTFSFSTNLMDSPIKLKAKLQGRDVSAGAWAELGEADIAVDSNGEYSVTFLNVTSTLPLNGDAGDYIQIELTGEGADNGSNFVLPDGTYRFEWFKLEEGNVFTGYEPTPYAIDEAECMKWFYSRPSAIVALPVFNSTANLTRYAQITFPAPMYFTPATFAQTRGAGYSGGVTQNSIGTHGYQIRGTASGTVSATSLTDVTASCEL
jgi:hypothetical protein